MNGATAFFKSLYQNILLLRNYGLSKITLLQCYFKYSFVSNKCSVANKHRVWKKYQNLINVGSGTNRGPGILTEKLLKIATFFDFHSNFQ